MIKAYLDEYVEKGGVNFADVVAYYYEAHAVFGRFNEEFKGYLSHFGHIVGFIQDYNFFSVIEEVVGGCKCVYLVPYHFYAAVIRCIEVHNKAFMSFAQIFLYHT